MIYDFLNGKSALSGLLRHIFRIEDSSIINNKSIDDAQPNMKLTEEGLSLLDFSERVLAYLGMTNTNELGVNVLEVSTIWKDTNLCKREPFISYESNLENCAYGIKFQISNVFSDSLIISYYMTFGYFDGLFDDNEAHLTGENGLLEVIANVGPIVEQVQSLGQKFNVDVCAYINNQLTIELTIEKDKKQLKGLREIHKLLLDYIPKYASD